MDRKKHWETVYETKTDTDVGWFQENPNTSLKLINKYAANKNIHIIDIGGGNSFLTKMLFDQGYANLTVLDISDKAIERSKSRFGGNVNRLNWISSNVLDVDANQTYDIWHDRAVFHFLTSDDEIHKYAKIAANNIIQNGLLVLGTFSVNGPTTCSGLPITQYDNDKLMQVFTENFVLVESFRLDHITPSGNPQNFIWAVYSRK